MNGVYDPVQAQLRRAQQELSSGRFAAAEAICRNLLSGNTQLLPALQLLGIALAQRGDIAGAENAFRQYISINPKSAPICSNLGNLDLMRGDFAGAVRWYRAAVKHSPGYAEAYFNLGIALKQLNQHAEALDALKQAIQAKPNYFEALVQSVSVLLAMKNYEAALATSDRAAAIKADSFEALYNRALALLGLNRLNEAKLALARASSLKPDDHMVFLKLGETLHSLREFDLATSALARAAVLKPDCAEAHAALAEVFLEEGWTKSAIDEIGKALAIDTSNAIYHITHGRILSEINRVEEAQEAYQKAVTLAPDSIEALVSHGHSYLTLGRLDEAKAMFQRALSLRPDDIRPYLKLARIGKFTPGDERLAGLESFLAKEDRCTASDRTALHFALGKAYDDCDDIDHAFEHYRVANALQNDAATFSEQAEIEWLDRNRNIYTRAFIRERRGSGTNANVPILILGMPRSGTTLIEQIITGHPAVSGAGEVPDFAAAVRILTTKHKLTKPLPELAPDLTREQLTELGNTYIERLQLRAPGAERVTDKLLGNYNHIGLIHLAAPNAAILHCTRNPIDCCVSIYTNHFATHFGHGGDLAGLGRTYRRYHELMAHWRSVLPEGAFLDIAYEDTVKDIEGVARRIIDHCGLEWDPACLDFQKNERKVTTLSITQVRQPLYATSVERWRRYERHLGPLIEGLGDLAPSR